MLAIWLPLTKDARNQGLEDVQLITNTEPTFVSIGKVGTKSMSTGSFSLPADAAGRILNNNEMSFSMWIYVNEPTGTANGTLLFGNPQMEPPNNRKFTISQYPTCNKVNISFQNDTTGTFISYISPDVFPSYKWTHLCVVYKNPKVIIYINGEPIYEANGVSNSSSFEYVTRLMSNSSTRLLNDYRVYTNALSPKEVKELAKGLAVHYPTTQIDRSRNLINNTTSNWVEISSKGNTTVILDSESNFGLTVGTKFTFSVDVDIPTTIKTARARVEFYNSDSDRISYTGTSSVTNAQGKINVIGAVLSGYSMMRLYIDFNASSDVTTTNVPCYYRNLKLEEGYNPNPIYTPAWEDDDSWFETTEYDTSGFCNNGITTIDKSPILVTPQNNCSGYLFKGTNEIILPETAKLTDAITVNLFAYKENWNTESAERLFGGNSNLCIGEVDNDGILFGFIRDGVWQICHGIKQLSNGWHMLSITYDGTILKYYVDAKCVFTHDYGSKALITYNTSSIAIGRNGVINNPHYFNGYMRDIRIYATALSLEDIKDLYSTGASITSNSTLMLSGELIEE